MTTMKYQIFWCWLLLLFAVNVVAAQQLSNTTTGTVYELSSEGDLLPLVGASVRWVGTSIGTSTNADGYFQLTNTPDTELLAVSFIGYMSDTLLIEGSEPVEVLLDLSVALEEVEITYRKKATEISFSDPLKIENIGEEELLKAACCNLSESFETSASVDVSFTDAVTGTRQIQMLGLAGPYTQITRENIPDIRGLSSMYGMTFIPGTWIESIQLNKGTGSVLNGFESIAGQINVELRKPDNADRLYLNLYSNEGGRYEANANWAAKLGDEKWSTAVLLHGKDNSRRNDRNDDGFMDNPLGRNFIGLNRWKYIGDNGLRAQFGIKGTLIDMVGGQLEFDADTDAGTTNQWGMDTDIQRLEGWMKMGKIYEESPWKSIALQLNAVTHSQDSYFGINDYRADQKSLYANFIYQDILGNTNHSFRSGVSFQYDKYDEGLNEDSFDRTESVQGVFFEYDYSALNKFSAVLGLRGDYHNLFGAFLTPRFHMRYALSDESVLRASAGRGQRTANLLAENNGLLASSREFVIRGDDTDKPYGLNPEVAWNFGANFTQSFRLGSRDGAFSVDFYRSHFENQIVVDLDASTRQVSFYNLDGKSYSNTFQAQVDYELIKRLDIRVVYRWFDVRTTYNGDLLQKPLVSPHRAFVNLSYNSEKLLKLDLTVNWQSSKRIPNTLSNPEEYRLSSRSPDFVVANFQISKSWDQRFDIYMGVENLFGFRQENPILSSDQPFSEYFDSTLVWGPIFGRNTYLGLRFRLR